MVEEYLIGSIGQSLERARQLRQIVQRQHPRYPREYDGLRQICLTQLDETQDILQYLAKETVVDTVLQTPRRVREFKRIVRQLDAIEGVGVFALSRTSPDDDFLNQLITDVCDEIDYPLISPTISHISQDYFRIYRGFNLLCLPLMETPGSYFIYPIFITNSVTCFIIRRMPIYRCLRHIMLLTSEANSRW